MVGHSSLCYALSSLDLDDASFSLAAVATLLLASAPPSFPELSPAIQAYQHLDDRRAIQGFQAILATNPPREVAAKAHLYLGLLAFNALKLELADEEFKRAIRADPTIEVPPDSSPKAALIFAEARQEVTKEVERPEAPTRLRPASANGDTLLVDQAGHPIAPARSHLLSFVLGGVGLALGLVAVVGGAQVISYDSYVDSLNHGDVKQLPTGAQVASQQSSSNFWRYGWVVFAAGGAGALAAGVMTW